MIDPKPLFEGEGEAGRPGALDLSDPPLPSAATSPGIVVGPLALGDAPVVRVSRRADIAVTAVGLEESAGLAQAIERGAAKFPAVMRESGFLVRNSLNQVLPLDFNRLTAFGRASLERAASLIGAVAELNARLHEVDAERLISNVVEAARAHAAHRRQTSILGFLGELMPFDVGAAERQITGVQNALLLRLEQLTAVSEAMQRLQGTLVVEVTTLAILDDMSDHGAMGEQLARRSLLFTTSLQEMHTASAQVESLRTQIQTWTMRCDEVRTITLPALGYTGSL